MNFSLMSDNQPRICEEHPPPGRDYDMRKHPIIEIPRKTILLAVLGVIGVGKTSFINVATGGGRVKGNSLGLSTLEILKHSTHRKDCEIILVDTPGFDNALKPDISILDEFVNFLKDISSKRADVVLSGIIYLHRITDIRMGGSATKNMQLIRELCGNDFLSHVTLVTTMWDSVKHRIGEDREKELLSSFWDDLLRNGAKYQRYDGTSETAFRVIDRYLDEEFPQARVRSKIEQQVIEIHQPLEETDAGRFVLEKLRQKVQQYTARLEEKKQTKEEIKYDPLLEEEAAEIEKEIKKGELELETYKKILADYRSPADAHGPHDDGVRMGIPSYQGAGDVYDPHGDDLCMETREYQGAGSASVPYDDGGYMETPEYQGTSDAVGPYDGGYVVKPESQSPALTPTTWDPSSSRGESMTERSPQNRTQPERSSRKRREWTTSLHTTSQLPEI